MVKITKTDDIVKNIVKDMEQGKFPNTPCCWEYTGTTTLENSLVLSAEVDDTHNL